MAPRVDRKRNNQSGEQPRIPGPDRISDLDDAMLLIIISLLPTKDAGRTTVLSKRFRNLWYYAPLNLNDYEFCNLRTKSCRSYPCVTKRIWAITKILDTHHGPVRRFCLGHGNFVRSEPFVENWLHIISRRHVKELELNFDLCSDKELPDYLLGCNSIETLTLCNSRFTSTSILSAAITGITEMTLSRIYIPEEDLEVMFSSCTSLCSLSLHEPIIEIDGISRVHVRSTSLVSLTIDYSSYIKELFILDAPKLDRVLLGPDLSTTVSIKIIDAPNLRIFGYLRMPIQMLLFGDICMKGFQVISGTVWSLGTLTISVRFDAHLEAAAAQQLLQCFPCLEILHIQTLFSEVHSAFLPYEDPDEPTQCLNHHLKKVIINGYEGRRGELEFVRFLLANGYVLKEVLLTGPRSKKEWMYGMKRELMHDPSHVTLTYTKCAKLQECKFKPEASNWFILDPFE